MSEDLYFVEAPNSDDRLREPYPLAEALSLVTYYLLVGLDPVTIRPHIPPAGVGHQDETRDLPPVLPLTDDHDWGPTPDGSI